MKKAFSIFMLVLLLLSTSNALADDVVFLRNRSIVPLVQIA